MSQAKGNCRYIPTSSGNNHFETTITRERTDVGAETALRVTDGNGWENNYRYVWEIELSIYRLCFCRRGDFQPVFHVEQNE